MLAQELQDSASVRQSLVIIPAGIGDTSKYQAFSRAMQHFDVVIEELPGTNDKTCESGSIREVANMVMRSLQKRRISSPILYGESCGGSVVIELARLMPVAGCILVASGEFFNSPTRQLLKTLFFPCRFSVRARRLYARVLRPMGPFKLLRHMTDEQLLTVFRRWMGTLSYEMPSDRLDVPTLIVQFSSDSIVGPRSRQKLAELFPQLRTLAMDGHHFSINDSRRIQVLDTFLNEFQQSAQMPPNPALVDSSHPRQVAIF
jgi:surfactin synthase thioesterase subunit